MIDNLMLYSAAFMGDSSSVSGVMGWSNIAGSVQSCLPHLVTGLFLQNVTSATRG